MFLSFIQMFFTFTVTHDSSQDSPRYFEIVKDPISLYQIQQRMNTGTYYRNVKSFRSDFYRLFDNARIYYDKDSQEYADAEKLEEVFMAAFIANIASTDMPGVAECMKA